MWFKMRVMTGAFPGAVHVVSMPAGVTACLVRKPNALREPVFESEPVTCKRCLRFIKRWREADPGLMRLETWRK